MYRYSSCVLHSDGIICFLSVVVKPEDNTPEYLPPDNIVHYRAHSMEIERMWMAILAVDLC